jgi:ATP-dependent exoDNAse (exonuclease V) alpha subunit
VARILELVKTRIPRRFGLDPIRDIQVLCPMNRCGVGARAINLELQAAANPAGELNLYRMKLVKVQEMMTKYGEGSRSPGSAMTYEEKEQVYLDRIQEI